MTDLVYVLGTSSAWGDRELFYSLRSVQDFLRDVGKVFILGAAPKIVPDFGVSWVHIPVKDEHVWPACNINACLLEACKLPELSDTFLRVDDDMFFLAPQSADAIPDYTRGRLPEHVKLLQDKPGSLYFKSLVHTVSCLNARRLPGLDFEVHGPMRFDKAKLKTVLSSIKSATGMLSRSLYGNTLRLAGEAIADSKIDSPLSFAEIGQRVVDRPFFSCGDKGLNHAMRTFLAQRFLGRVV